MIRIRRHKRRTVPTLNMASMPDLIFTVLFFFMIVTHMRSESPRLQLDTPTGKELTKPTNRRNIANLYIGKDAKGTVKIQVGDKIVPLQQVGAALLDMRNKLQIDDPEQFVVNIRADKNTPMGTVADVKQELRKFGLLSIRYNATETTQQH